MDIQISVSMLFTIGGVIASIASSSAITKTKIAAIEESFEEEKEKVIQYGVELALLKTGQEGHDRELNEMKADLKEIKKTMQEIKETVLLLRKEVK